MKIQHTILKVGFSNTGDCILDVTSKFHKLKFEDKRRIVNLMLDASEIILEDKTRTFIIYDTKKIKKKKINELKRLTKRIIR